MTTRTAVAFVCFCALPLGFKAGSARAQSARTSTSGATFQDSTNELSVGVGKTVLVDTAAPMTRAAVGLGDVAEVLAVSPTELMVNGKTVGETSLIIWDIKGGRQFFNVIVHPDTALAEDNLAGMERELRAQLPEQPIRVSFENGNVYLRGTVDDLTSSERAVRIASTAGKVVNLLDVKVPSSEPQILLKVRFASVSLSKERQLGINLFSSGFGNVLGSVSTGGSAAPTVTAGAAGSSSVSVSNDLNLFAFLPGLNLGGTLQALETDGVVELLAEPNLLATNGKEASFLSGGEYPYPTVEGTSSGSAAVSIQFQEYGIRLNFIPTITPRGTIRLQVAPEVSALDYTNEVTISGFTVPGITTQKVNTEVELKDGQTLVIGGLLDKSVTQTFEKIPFLGDIPILGKFFQSLTRTKNNAELIVIVTPEIVAPIPAGQPAQDLHYPVPFLPNNSHVPMHNPDVKTAANTPAPAPPVIPIETLIDSMKPEKPLIIESGAGNFGTGGAQINSGAPGGASVPTAPPQ